MLFYLSSPHQHLSPGMLILGSVKQIYDLELSVALPNGVTGVVSITDVCDAYTDILREITSDEADEAGQEVRWHVVFTEIFF